MSSTDPSVCPYPEDTTEYRIWRGLECRARGTLLVHGSKALEYLGGCGSSVDPREVISRMVENGVLKPCKVDLAGADHSVKAFVGLQFTGKYIKSQPWSTAFALLWTYEPVNSVPMKGWYP